MDVLIVEDHHVVNVGLQAMLKSTFDPINILLAKDISAALYQMASNKNIQLVITDLELDKGDWAIDLIKSIRKQSDKIRIIVYSKFEEKGLLNQCIKAGADAYLSKKVEAQDLLNCVKSVMEKGRTISVTEQKIDQLADQVMKKSFLTPEEKFQELSEREREVALLIYQNLSRNKIADRLFVGAETVKTHTRHIYEKLAIDSKAKLQFFFEMNPHLIPD